MRRLPTDMYIVPMNNSITPLDTMSQTEEKTAGSLTDGQPSFTDVFKEAFRTVQETQEVVESDSIKLAVGEIDDLHTINLNRAKATLAVDTFVALKNSAVEAYNEIIRMNI